MTDRPQRASWKKRWWMIALAVVALAGLVILYFVYQPDLKSIHTRIASFHWLAVLLLVSILPIFGFSVALCYVIIGAKFGVGWGLVVIALATVVHLLGSH
ncbi:MAG: hypothetical protein ABIQ35_13065, partial [Verrucomicrobiota bacterium]